MREHVGTISEIVDTLGEGPVMEALADAISYQDLAGSPDVPSLLRNHAQILLAPDTSRDAWEDFNGFVTQSVSNSLEEMRSHDMRFESVDALMDELCMSLADELFEAYQDSESDAEMEVARDFLSNVEGLPGFEGSSLEGSLDAADVARDLVDEYGLFYDYDTEAYIREATFSASVVLSRTDECHAERELHDSILQWHEDSFDLVNVKDEDAVHDRWEYVPSGDGVVRPWERPADVPGHSAYDTLCASQGTSLEDVVNGGGGAFGRSFLEDMLNCPDYGWPALAVMCSMDGEQFVGAAACMLAHPQTYKGVGPVGTAFVVPADDETRHPCLVGLFDPVNGASGTMGVTLERPFEVPASEVWLTMQEPERGGQWGGFWTPQETCGFCEPFDGIVGEPSPGEGPRLRAGNESLSTQRTDASGARAEGEGHEAEMEVGR